MSPKITFFLIKVFLRRYNLLYKIFNLVEQKINSILLNNEYIQIIWVGYFYIEN